MSSMTKNNQRGIVSMMVTMIMMLVISLIVIGFAQVARRNQREALDRQLSTQAYYAAESGINAAVNFFHNNPSAPALDTLSSGHCTDPIKDTSNPSSPVVQAPIVLNPSSGGSAQTSCLMVNSKPASLVADPVTQDSNIVWHLKDSSGNPFTGLTFSWAAVKNYVGTNTCTSVTGSTPPYILPKFTDWNCAYGILRVDLVPAGNINATDLDDSAQVRAIYMIPSGLNSNDPTFVTAATTTSSATIVKTPCSTTTGKCSVQITGLGSSEYYARLTMLYQDSAGVDVVGSDAANPVGGVKFDNGQAVIDSTGKAQDELRRVQVRIPLVRTDSALPIFGLQSTNSICKELTVAPGGPPVIGPDCT